MGILNPFIDCLFGVPKPPRYHRTSTYPADQKNQSPLFSSDRASYFTHNHYQPIPYRHTPPHSHTNSHRRTSSPAPPRYEPASPMPPWERTDADVATDLLAILSAAESATDTRYRLHRAFGARTSTEYVAESVLDGIMALIESGRRARMGPALEEAVDRAIEAARAEFEFGRRGRSARVRAARRRAEEEREMVRQARGDELVEVDLRSRYVEDEDSEEEEDEEDDIEGALTIVAVGALAQLTEHWMVLDPLGFQEVGPIKGSIAAWWNLKYVQAIPKGAVQRFFARLNMEWMDDENLIIVESPFFDPLAFDGDVVERPASPMPPPSYSEATSTTFDQIMSRIVPTEA